MSVAQTRSALIVPEHGDASVLRVEDQPVPGLSPDQVLVRVAATGVNFIDVYDRRGTYPHDTPFVLGREGAGVVEQIGAQVTEVSVGDRVAWAMQLGSAASLAVLPAQALVPVPEEVDLETAAAVLLQGMTAHFLVNDTFPCGPATTALVHAAAGGVGQLLVQLLAEKGATIIATAGSPEKLELARALGAEHLINYRDHESPAALAQAVRAAARGGVDVVYDGVGKSTFDASLASLRRRGLMVLFGAASGPVEPFDPQRLNKGGSLYLTRPSLGDYIATRQELVDRGRAVLELVASGKLRLRVDSRVPLDEAAEAYRALEERRTSGKVVLIP